MLNYAKFRNVDYCKVREVSGKVEVLTFKKDVPLYYTTRKKSPTEAGLKVFTYGI